MPFDFLRRKKSPTQASSSAPARNAGDGRAAPTAADGGQHGSAEPGRGVVAPTERSAGDAAGSGPQRGVSDGAARAASTRGATGGSGVAGPLGASGAPGASRAAPSAVGQSSGAGIRFDALTEDWHLIGTMHVDGRLSDVLNRRESVAISDVVWAPIDGSAEMVPAPGLRSIDPYDLIAVLAGPDTLPEYSEAERIARRVRKEPYQVVLEAPPFRILGTVHVFPGTDPRQMLDQVPEMFIPLTGAVAYVSDQPVAEPGVEVVLVNRLYVRGVDETGR